MVSYTNYNKLEEMFGNESNILLNYILQDNSELFHAAILEVGERAKRNPADSAMRYVKLLEWGYKWYDFLGLLSTKIHNPNNHMPISSELFSNRNFLSVRKISVKLKELSVPPDGNIDKLKHNFRIFLEKSYNDKIFKNIKYFIDKQQEE